LIRIKGKEEVGSELMIVVSPLLLGLLEEMSARKTLDILTVYLITAVHYEERHKGKGVVFPFPFRSSPFLIG
jgi:hypothetical protein